MSLELTVIEIPPASTHLYTIIWLHGLGADGHDFEGIVPQLHFPQIANTLFIFPNAPEQPVTINGGMVMRSWFDITGPNLETDVDITAIYRSASALERLIQQEIDKGIPSEHILLAGFSQGGVIALHTGLRYTKKLAGIIVLSACLPTAEQLKIEGSTANYPTPVFFGHGILDAVIAIELAKSTFDALDTLGYNVKWHDYLMAHAVSGEEIQHIAGFIESVVVGDAY